MDAERATAPRPRLVVRLVGYAFFTLIFAALALVITELGLQTSSAWSLYREVRRHPPHPFLQILPAFAVDHVNQAGFRGDEIQLAKPPNTFRVFTIGGSTTIGVTNAYPDTYPFLLQTILRERHPDVTVEVQNAGGPWYTTAHDLVAYEVEVRKFNPDLIIVFEAINDLTRSFSPPWLSHGDFKPDYSHYLGPYARFYGPGVGYISHPSAPLTWAMLRHWMTGEPDPFDIRHPENVAKVAATLKPNDQPAFRSLPSFRLYLDSILHAVQSDDHVVIAASQPYLYRTDLTADDQQHLYFAPLLCADHGTYPSLAAMVRGMQQYNAAAREVAEARHVPFVDFEAAVPKTLEYFSDDVHMRRSANELIAKAAADAIDAAHLVQGAVRR